jgi:tetratricopeptide (TPR) repeat protein
VSAAPQKIRIKRAAPYRPLKVISFLCVSGVLLGLVLYFGFTYRLQMQALAGRVLERLADGDNPSAQSSYPSPAQVVPAAPPDSKPSGNGIVREFADGDEPSSRTSRSSPKSPEAVDSPKRAENPKTRETSVSRKSVLDLIASGNLHYSRREYDSAIADYTEASHLSPRNAAALAYRGNTYHAMKRFDNAIADYTEAIRLDPNYAEAFYRRGIARQSKGDRAGGEADIKAARAIDPSAGVDAR